MPGQQPPTVPVPASVSSPVTARSAYTALAALDSRGPVAVARRALLRRLAEVTRADHVQLWLVRPDDGGRLRSAICWPPDAVPDEEIDAGDLARRPDLRAHAVLRDGDRTVSVVSLTSRRQLSRARRRELDDTANCLLVLHHREQLQTRLRHQLSYTAQLAGEVLDSSRRLAGVRELERRRVAAEVATFSRSRLTPVQEGVDRLVHNPRLTGELEQLRTQLDRMVADFRALVRGIHPQVLYRQGLRAALAEVAAAYPGPVPITGTVAARVDHEVAASLYYLSAAAMHELARTGAALKIALEHRQLDTGAAGLQVALRARTAPGGPGEARMRAALAMDADRLGALGGWVRVDGENDRLRVVAWVPDRLEPPSRAALASEPSLHARVRAQALGLVARYGQAAGSARARRLLSRLDEPVHVAVRERPDGRRFGRITENIRTRTDLMLVPAPPDAGTTPAGGLRVLGDLSIGILESVPDVIVRSRAGAREERFDLVLPGGGALRTDVDWRDLADVLTTEVVARADLLRARTALATMLRLARLTPPPAQRLGSLDQDLEELRLSATELADLEARAGSRSRSERNEAMDGGTRPERGAYL